MRFPRPDGVSLTNGLIVVGYEDQDERDMAFDWLDAYGAGATSHPNPIKPLAWNEYYHEGDLDELDAETPFGTFYKIEVGLYGFYVRHEYDLLIGIFEGLEAAMVAAQQDYEKRLGRAYGN